MLIVLKAAWTILTSRLAGPIATGAALLLALLLLIQGFTLHHARGELKGAQKALAAAQLDLGTCRANTATLEATLGRQNEAVATLKAEADAKQAQSAKAVSAARNVAESYRRSATSILATKPGPDACADADRLILENAR